MQGMSRLALVILLPSTLLPQAKTTEIPFPGGVTFEARFANDTHKRVCSVATPMRGVQAVVLGGSIVNVLVNEPLRRGPTGMPRAYVGQGSSFHGQGSSFQLNAGDRVGVMLVPENHVPGLIRALYAGDPVSVRWQGALGRRKEIVPVVAGDFGAAYDRAVQECQWPAVQAPRAAPPSKEPRIVQTGAVTGARFADGWEVRIDAPGFCSLNTPRGQPLSLARAGRQQTPMYDSDPFLFRADGSEEAPLPRLIVPDEIAKVAREAGDYGFMELDGKRFTAYGLAEAADYLRANCGPIRFERIRGVPVFRPTASVLPRGTVIASFGTGWTVTVAPGLCKLTTQLGDALYWVESGSRVTIMDYGEMSFRAPDKEQPRRLARPASLSDLIDAGDFAGAEGTATIFSVTYSAKGFADAARFAAERCPRQDRNATQR